MDKKMHDVAEVWSDKTHLHMTVDGHSYRIRWADCSPHLLAASDWQRQRFDVSPSGYGIHWPEIDEDLAIAPLLLQAETVDGFEARNRVPVLAESRETYGLVESVPYEGDLQRIVSNPKVMLGKPVIKGTRLTVEHILNLLASGVRSDEIIAEYDGLSEQDIRACLRFAAQSLRELAAPHEE
jgi:uncharacterized protein (DUF433 family)